MSRVFQVVPLYLDGDTTVRDYFSDANFNDLESISGSRFILSRPQSAIGLFEEEGRQRYPKLESRDLPCLWAEDDTKAHFKIALGKQGMDDLRELFCDLGDAAENAGSVDQWEHDFRRRQNERIHASDIPAMPKVKEIGPMEQKSSPEHHGEMESQPGQGSKTDKNAVTMDWTLGWGKIAGIGGLSLAAFVTIVLKFAFPQFPAAYIPMLLIFLYGIAIIGCIIWLVEKLIARPNAGGGDPIIRAIAIPAICLVFALALGVFAFLTLPKSSTAQAQSPQTAEAQGTQDEPEIRGIVLDAGGNAVGRALVSVEGRGKEAQFTDATGDFVLPSHAKRLAYVNLHAERPPDGPANLEGFVVGSGTATLHLGPRARSVGKSFVGKNSKDHGSSSQYSQPYLPKNDGTHAGNPQPQVSPNSCDSFQNFMGDEAALATLAERAFSRKEYACVLIYLEQAKKVQSSGVWERDYPLLAAAYPLARNDSANFRGALNDMLGEMRRSGSYLHHGPTIGFALKNLSEVRPYLDSAAQAIIDDTINQATQIRSTMPN
jgi:hypothetical protein